MQEGQPPEDELNPWGHCMVVWGNLLYEHSQFQAAVGKVFFYAWYWTYISAGCLSLSSSPIHHTLDTHSRVTQLACSVRC